MNNIKKLPLVCIVLLITISSIFSAFANVTANPNYSPSDVLAFKRINQVVPANDEKQIVFTVYQAKSTSLGKSWEYSLYLKNSKSQIKLLDEASKISSVLWSPNGKLISYLAKGNQFQSIWIYNITTNEKQKLLEFKNDISSFKWSPNGKFIAFTAQVIKSNPSKALAPIDVSNAFSNTRLYLYAIQNGTIKPITAENYSVSGYDWSPDQKVMVISYQQRAGELYVNQSKIALIDVEKLKQQGIPYTENHAGIQPFYSPDGKYVAFQSNLSPRKRAKGINSDIALNNQICLTNTNTLQTKCLSNTFNENPQIIGWNKNSNGIFVLDAYKTTGYLIYEISVSTPTPAKAISNVDGFIEPLTISMNNSHDAFGFGYESVNQPPEAFISSTHSFHLIPVSHVNSQHETFFGNTKVIRWKSPDGMTMEGLLVTPANYNKNKKYSLYVAVHGGPAGVWGKRYLGGCDEYGEMIDPSTCWGNLLNSGFVIFQPNPRGSSGYGLSFRLANFADFGGGDYRDIMSGVDYLIHRGIADPNHLAIGGWSFGGYMTTWIISHTNRFKAAVDGDGNTDFISFSGTSDIPDYYIRYLGTPFWNAPKLYLERAPIMHVKNIHTPLLILQGENDKRVPPGQSYELYTALILQNKPVKMLILPDQEHVPTDPNIILESIKEVNFWLKQAIPKTMNGK